MAELSDEMARLAAAKDAEIAVLKAERDDARAVIATLTRDRTEAFAEVDKLRRQLGISSAEIATLTEQRDRAIAERNETRDRTYETIRQLREQRDRAMKVLRALDGAKHLPVYMQTLVHTEIAALDAEAAAETAPSLPETPEARLATILDHAAAADPAGVLLYFHTPAEAEAFLADYTRRGAEAREDAGVIKAAQRVFDELAAGGFRVPDEAMLLLRTGIRAALREGAEAMREASMGAVDAEEELEGEPPEAVIKIMLDDPPEFLRATVRATKRGIRNRIRALPIPGKTDAG